MSPASTATARPKPAADNPVRLADFSTSPRVIVLSIMAVAVGAISSVVAWVLLWLIAVITNFSFYQKLSDAPVTPQGNHLGWWVVAVPVIGALIIGIMARFGSEKIRGHGIPEALEAILLGRSLIQLRVALLKPLSAAISIGTGGPYGAEGPIIMTGGAFGSLFAQRFNLSAAERKTLLCAGAAGGMTAVFSAPIASVLLAVELLLFEWKPRSYIPVTVSVIVASILRVPLLGAGPIFPVTLHAAPSGTILAWAAVLGVLAGFVSGLVTRLVYFSEDLFLKLPLHWMWWPALGAIVVGVGGVIEPRVLGVGYDTIHRLLRGEMVGGVLVGLLVAKALVWSISLGSGTSGGVLAPLLLMGGALGGALTPWIPAGDASLWSLVSMAAMMSGTMCAPLTAMVFVVELTGDYQMLPATLTGCMAALGVTVLLMKRSILTEKLARRGHHLTREYSIDPFELARVQDVMDRTVPSVSDNLPLADYTARIAQGDQALSKRQATILVDEAGRLSGIVTRGDIVRAVGTDSITNMTVSDAGSKNVVVTYPGELLSTALNKMLNRDIGRLPVVDPSDDTRIVGYLGRSCILSARLRLHQEENIREKG